MYYLRIPWPEFIETLRLWEKIPAPARDLFLKSIHTAQLMDPALFGPHLPVLLESGLIELSAVKQWVKTTPGGCAFTRPSKA